MIVSLHLEDHDYLIDSPMTINLGGEYLYSFIKVTEDIEHVEYIDITIERRKAVYLVRRKKNDKYISDFFNISESVCKVELLSAIVGENGTGKSTVLDSIRSIFNGDSYYNRPIVLAEINGVTKKLFGDCKIYLIRDVDNQTADEDITRDFISKYKPKSNAEIDGYDKLDIIDRDTYQSIYYSPHFDLKYNNEFGERYNISLDQFIKKDLEATYGNNTDGDGWDIPLHEELMTKNSMRQIEFLHSSIFQSNLVFREVFDLPKYNEGLLIFKAVKPQSTSDIPFAFKSIIEDILKKIEEEEDNREQYMNLSQAEINKYLLERFVIKAFMSIVIKQMDKKAVYLFHGKIDYSGIPQDSALNKFFYFINNSRIEIGEESHLVFNTKDITDFFTLLDSLFIKELNPDNIEKQIIKLNLNLTIVKEIFELHSKIITKLINYYPKKDNLVKEGNYIEGFITFKPTDRNMSSGENALLNFFSKLYNFIETNLTEKLKGLPDKQNYVLLLDEADLGFHPVWKKRYVDAILKALPYFFESLQIKPKLQIIITTHDPLTLSDIPINNVTFLSKNKNNGYCQVLPSNAPNSISKTFGANITDLLAHSFFVEDGLIGDFSKSKIQDVIKWINKSKKLSKSKKSEAKFRKELSYYRKVVDLIDEKIIRIKLTEMIAELMPDSDDYYNQMIDKEIELLKKQRR